MNNALFTSKTGLKTKVWRKQKQCSIPFHGMCFRGEQDD